MIEKLIMILQFLLGLLIIVSLHELGHLLFAKLFGMRVERYMIGFPPKLFSFKWGETEYSLGLIPLGGLVKIAGIIDENLDTDETLESTPQPWEFRAKPGWQRLIVILGGVLFNLISGIIIAIILTFNTGESFLSKDEVNKHGILPSELAMSLGFQEGDQIIKINGNDFNNFYDIYTSLLKANYYTIIRKGEIIDLQLPANFLEQLEQRLVERKNKAEYLQILVPLVPLEINKVMEQGAAAQVGLQSGDKIVGIGEEKVMYLHQLKKIIPKYINKEVTFTYIRNGTLHTANIFINDPNTLGIDYGLYMHMIQLSPNLLNSIVIGTTKVVHMLQSNVVGIKKMITGKISVSNLSGPIGIIRLFDGHFQWIKFWNIVYILSTVIALTNLLPIPALDGGHAWLIIFEIITRRRLSIRFLENIQKVGIIILLFLAVYTFFNDLYKLWT